MFLLRRAATRAVAQQPTRSLSTLRPASRVTSLPKPTLLRSLHQSRIWQADGEQKKTDEASPADATTSGETVTTKPTRAEEQLRDDAAASTRSSAEQPASAHDAVSESSGTTNTTSQPKSSASSLAEQAQDYASSAAESVQSAASTAATTARKAFDRTARSNQGATSADFPPRERSRRDDSRGLRSNDRNGDRSFRSNDRNETPAKPSRILYVGNLFFEVTAPQLEAEFARMGEIANSRIVTDERGMSKGFGYIEFATQEEADRAIQELNQTTLQGRRMSVQYHVRRERTGALPGSRDGGEFRSTEPRQYPKNEPSKTLFIGNLSYQMSDRDLNDLFREIRNVLDVRVAIDRRSGQPRGFAHADFIDMESAKTAKDFLESKSVYGRQLRVDFSSNVGGGNKEEA